MPGFETLLLAVEDGVARLTLNRPGVLNAIDRRMAAELTEALRALRAREDVRVLVLHGAGEHFCAGGDVKGMGEAGPRGAPEARAGMARYRHMTEALHGFDRPVIAAVDGVAYGAGFSLLLLADLVLLSERARLCMVFGRVGLLPDCGALHTLPRAVGLQRARELVFSAREIGAAEAQAMGLALEVLRAEALLARALAMARSLTQASPLALSLAKRQLQGSLDDDLERALMQESDGQAQALASDYHREAVRRFTEREAPLFQWPPPPR